MRILYLSLSVIPSRRASSVQVMKMCAALARRGHEVVLVAKRGEDAGNGVDDHAHYCVEPSFVIDKVDRPRRRRALAYAAGMAVRVARRRGWADVVYCREAIGALIAAQLGLPVVFEAHGIPIAWWQRAAVARAVSRTRSVGIVAISEALRRDLEESRIAAPGRPLVVAPDACDPPVTAAARRRVGTPPVVGYVGGLYPGRGVELILELAADLPRVTFRLVGGGEADLARLRAGSMPANVELLGFRPQAELPALYAGMDVVVMPYARAGILSEHRAIDTSRWTSPMKMFEYMASGVPLVSSNLPVLREVLRDGANSLLVAADDVGAWRGAIERLLADDDLRFRLARAAQDELVASYTWDARARSVMTGLGLEPVVTRG